MKLLLAYWASIRAMVRLYGVGQTVEELLHALAFLIPAFIWPSMRTTAEERARRREACGSCDVYNGELATCGTPGRLEDGMQVGCWCPIAVSSIPRSKVCWKELLGEDRWAGTYGEKEEAKAVPHNGPTGE